MYVRGFKHKQQRIDGAGRPPFHERGLCISRTLSHMASFTSSMTRKVETWEHLALAADLRASFTINGEGDSFIS